MKNASGSFLLIEDSKYNACYKSKKLWEAGASRYALQSRSFVTSINGY